MTEKEARQRSLNWWYCDNIVNKERIGEIGLLKMDFPQAFILIRDDEDVCFATYEEFSEHIAEVNFFNPKDREDADIEEILIDAWNFMAMQEREEERLAGERELEELEDDF